MGRCNGSGGAPVPWGSRESERPASGGFWAWAAIRRGRNGCKLVARREVICAIWIRDGNLRDIETVRLVSYF